MGVILAGMVIFTLYRFFSMEQGEIPAIFILSFIYNQST